jgi:hypothetical protein
MRDTAVALIDTLSYASLDIDNFLRSTRPDITSSGADITWLFLLFGAVVMLGSVFIYAKYIKPLDAKKACDCDESMDELEHITQRVETLDAKMSLGFRETHARIDQIFELMVKAK